LVLADSVSALAVPGLLAPTFAVTERGRPDFSFRGLIGAAAPVTLTPPLDYRQGVARHGLDDGEGMGMRWKIGLAVVATAALAAGQAAAEEIGCVSTVFKVFGPDHKICIEAFDDPKVEGVTCHLTRPRTGGLSGMVGLAEDPSDSSIACRQVGPIRILEDFDPGETVFSERRSVLFKKMSVRRFLDKKRNVLIYLVVSDKLIEGSPKHSVSSVPIMPWRGE
jgi:CreA protein